MFSFILALAFQSPITIEDVPPVTYDFTATTSIAAYIEHSAMVIGVPTETAFWIASCESSFYPTAKNASSTASGVYQWLNGSWKYYGGKLWPGEERSVFNAKDNIDLALWVMKTKGTSDWNESKWCWGKHLQPNLRVIVQ